MAALLAIAAPRAGAQNGQINVLTYHNDLARTGQNLNETLLTPTTVSATQFGKLFGHAVDGQVYGQPLYLAGVSIAGKGRHNVVYVVTEHDSVYAFDADSGSGANATPLWQVSFLTSPSVTTVKASEIGCGQVTPEIGITATPVIDVNSGTIYIVAMTKEPVGGVMDFVQRIHALDIGSGAEKPGSPVVVQASIPGSSLAEGDGATVTFRPRNYKERTGLLLLNGTLYTTWASHCDIKPYHGWILGYDAATLARTIVYNVTPNAPETASDPLGDGSSFWNAGAAPAADDAGNIYILSANGTFDPANQNYGNCFLRLAPSGGTLTTADYFAPFNQSALNGADLDIGSSGAVLLPDAVGSVAHPHLMVSAGKEGRIYLLDRDTLGHQSAADINAVQTLPGATGGALFGIPAYWNGNVYFSAVSSRMKAFSIAGAHLSTGATSQAPESFGYPGSTPTISANGATNGIVWALEAAGVLRAYNALNLTSEIYNTSTNAGRDALDGYVKYSSPTITNGRVYAGTGRTVSSTAGAGSLFTFGLVTPPTLATDFSAQIIVKRGGFRFERASGHYFQAVTLTNAGPTAATGPVSLVLDGLNATARLVSGGGVTTSYAGATGNFYQNAAGLAAGQSTTLTLEFAPSSSGTPISGISYTTRVLSGTGAR